VPLPSLRSTTGSKAAGSPRTVLSSRPSTFRLTRNLIAGVALLTTLAGWWVGYRATNRMAESAERAALSQDVVGTVRGVIAALSRASAAARDQAITTDQRLNEFQRAAGSYRTAMARLRRLMSDDADQLARVAGIDNLIAPRLAALEATVAVGAVLPSSGPAAVPLVTSIDGPLGELEAHEQSLAEERAREARANAGDAALVQTLNALVTLFTVIGAFVLFNHDFSRQERDEARLREALTDADAANEAKSAFLATVSHEIRTPLTAVSGMSELLLETRLDPEQTEFATAVYNNAEALSMLIGDLLDSSRIEAGQVFLDSAPFDLRELVEGVAELLAVRADAKGVDLVIDVPPAAPRRLVGDRMRLRQVLMNLVGNAVKFTERGEVAIRTRVEPAAEGQVRVRLAVIDTGVGIPREAQARIFERFAQAERSTVRRYGGTGLGLNISRSLVELMGGKLTVQSEPGRGSTFEAELTLPLAPTQPLPDIVPASLAGVDVLLVQQNATLRGVKERLLQYAGASVRAVGTGAEAVAQIAQRRPAVIALGERLPDSSGLEVAMTLWRDQYGAAAFVPVILMCPLRARAAGNIGSYGITACVYEPVKQARLISAVRQAAGLEAEPVTRKPEEARPPVPDRTTRPHVLVVEDNRENWTRAMRILGEQGCDADLAENGEDAVTSASARDYDIIFMDVALPGIDGIEATRRIRAQESQSARQVPIVALTAHAIDSVRQDAFAAGVSDYVTKPFTKQQLIDVCMKWIDRRPLLLIADDAPDSQLLFRNYLRGGDYRLVFAVNGQEAVAAFKRRRPSLILLDMSMPVMDGYEAARTIRVLPGGDTVPILAVTAHDGPQEAARCLAAGCTEVLSKPVRRGDFLARVAGLLGPQVQSHGPVERELSSAALPPARDAADRIDRQLAVRDFDGVAMLAGDIGATARTEGWSDLAAVSDALIGAARAGDADRSAWWAKQLISLLRAAAPPRPERRAAQPSPGTALDALARLASLTLAAPAAGVALLGGDRLRIVGSAGLPPALDISQGFPRDKSITRVILAEQGPLAVEDARTDPRLRETLLVLTYGIVAIAGVPLVDVRGAVVGSLFVVDNRPRRWPSREVAMLEELAAVGTRLVAAEGSSAPVTAAAADDSELVVDDDIVDLLPDYVAARRRDLVTLRASVERDDLEAIARIAHQMKGSGAGYGLPVLTRLGGAIEAAANGGDAAAIPPLVDDLDAHLARLRIRSADGRVSLEL
jgi:signal transduction histidine kinase/CheY-like chemotaxis protein